MNRKKIKSSRYVAALALTIIIFLIGFIIGGVINGNRLQRVYDLEHDIRIESLGNELVYQMVTQDLCKNLNLSSYTSELSKLGKKLTYLESTYKYNKPQVENLKKYYSLLLIRHWIINEKANKECNVTTPSVLYFYTNYKKCNDCEDQGLVLTNVHQKYPFFNVYSIEFLESTPTLEFLKEKYNLSLDRLPTLVIDDKVFYGFQSKSFLIKQMNLESRLAEEKRKEDAKKASSEKN